MNSNSNLTTDYQEHSPPSSSSPVAHLASAEGQLSPDDGNNRENNNFLNGETVNSIFQPFLHQFARNGSIQVGQVGQVPEIEQSLSQQFRSINVRAKFILPFFLLLLVKYFFDNLQCFLLVASLAILSERAKSLLQVQFALKDKADIYQLLYATSFSVVTLLFFLKILPQLDYQQNISDRLLLKCSDKSFPKKLLLLHVVWDCYLTDWFVQLSYNTVKAVVFLLFLQKDRIGKLSGRLSTYEWFTRAGRKVHVHESKASETSDLENQSNPLLASGLVRRASRSHRESDLEEQQYEDDTTEASEFEDPQKKISRMRLLSLFDIVVYMYRSLLPIPVWAFYLSYGNSSFQTFSVIYLAVKFIDYSWKFKGTMEAVDSVLGRKLEFGHYSTTSEYNPLTCTYDCPICFDSPKNAVTLECQHIFCEACIYEWLDKEKTCPVCRKEIDFSSSTLHTLKQEVNTSRHLFV